MNLFKYYNRSEELDGYNKQYMIDTNESKEWWLNGELHQEDGPAVEYTNGSKLWYLHGKLHREDGPAVERANGTKEWWLNDERHNTSGPAIIRSHGFKSGMQWWLNGKQYFEEDWKQKVKDL